MIQQTLQRVCFLVLAAVTVSNLPQFSTVAQGVTTPQQPAEQAVQTAAVQNFPAWSFKPVSAALPIGYTDPSVIELGEQGELLVNYMNGIFKSCALVSAGVGTVILSAGSSAPGGGTFSGHCTSAYIAAPDRVYLAAQVDGIGDPAEVYFRWDGGTLEKMTTDAGVHYDFTLNDVHGRFIAYRSLTTTTNSYWSTDGNINSDAITLTLDDVSQVRQTLTGLTADGAFLIHEQITTGAPDCFLAAGSNQPVSPAGETIVTRIFWLGSRSGTIASNSYTSSNCVGNGTALRYPSLNSAGAVLSAEYSASSGSGVVGSMLHQFYLYPADGSVRSLLAQGELINNIGPYFTQSQNPRMYLTSAGQPLLQLTTTFGGEEALFSGPNPVSDAFDGDFIQGFGQDGDPRTMLLFSENGHVLVSARLADTTTAYALGVASKPRTWSLLVYLDGDNNLADTYPAIFNHLETMANLPGLRILVLWDSTGTNDSGYYEVQYDTNTTKYANYTQNVNFWTQGELNMGAPFTLSDFIIWGVGHAPADHFALILDDHGSGLGGLAWDDTSSGDHITLAELKLGLSTAFGQTGRKLDVLYMAMCLMGMLEDSYQVRGLVDYYVASEELQTTYHRYLTGFDPQNGPAAVAQTLAAAYADTLASQPAAAASAYTISVADLAQLDPLVNATNALAQALDARTVVISGTLSGVAAIVQRFDNEAPINDLTQADTAIDLYDFADLLAQNLSSEPDIVAKAVAVKTAIGSYILYERHGSVPAKNMDGSHGVSIFFPGVASSFYNSTNYDFAVGATWDMLAPSARQMQTTTTWGGFLVNYIHATQPGGPDDPTPPLPLSKTLMRFAIFIPSILRR